MLWSLQVSQISLIAALAELVVGFSRTHFLTSLLYAGFVGLLECETLPRFDLSCMPQTAAPPCAACPRISGATRR